MALLDFTTYGDIRASLGVSSDDITDATLSLSLYESSLVAEIDDVDAGIADAYADLKDSDITTLERVEQRFVQAVRLFATYAVAKQLTAALPMFGPKEHTDGKASVTRFSNDPYKETVKKIEEQYGTFRQRLEASFKALSSSTAAAAPLRTYMTVSVPTSDPVTGT